MKEIVMNYIVWLLISKDKSYNEIEKELLWFFLNIKRISYDSINYYSIFDNHISKDNIHDSYYKLIQNLYRNRFKESCEIDEELDNLCEDIANRIMYNENMTIFTKYI